MFISGNTSGRPPVLSSDQTFHLLFEHHPVPMWIYDLETLAFLAVNDAAVNRYGYSREEFLRMTIKDIRPEDEVPRLLDDLARQRPPWQRSEGWRHRLKDGTVIEVEINSHTLEFNQRQAVLVMAQDITSRKQAEEALRLTRFTVERLVDAVYWLDSDGRIVDVNDTACRTLGYSREELLRLSVFDIDPEFSRDDWREGWPVLREQRTVVYEGRLRTRDGRLIPVEVTANFIEFNGRELNCGLARDISGRQQAEAALREVQGRLQRVVSAANVGLWEWDLATNQVYFSPEWKRQIGYADHEISNDINEWQSRLHPDDRDRTVEMVHRFATNPWPDYNSEFRLRHKDGSYRWILVQASLLLDEQGRPSRMLGSHLDITSLKQLEAEKEALATQLAQAQKMEAIGRLAGGIAHDFNNLLVPIIGYAELGQMALAPGHPAGDNFERIKEAGERAAGLTRQILAFSRQQVLEMKSLDLNRVVSDFEPMLKRLIGEDVALYTGLAACLPPVRADRGQLEQALLNLVINARDAMPYGGTLIIETGLATLDESYAASHAGVRPGPYVVLSVSDTGQGMDAETREHIFEPFFTTKPMGQGSGLGLATVFGIVRQHQGTVWVYSEPGQGATFKVYLPVAEAPVLSPAAPPQPAPPVAVTETVLLVEDDGTVRKLVGDVLRSHGYRVLATGDAEAGLALAAVHPGSIHLLLTDVILPGKNGRELYQHLAGRRPGLKVLYMSGYTGDVIAHHHVLDEGADFLQKPFTMDELLQRIRLVLG